MNKEEFIKYTNDLGINLDNDKLSKLEKYYNLLIEWNKNINLTTILDREGVYLKHFYDSLTLVKAINFDDDLKICDVGTGAGFPGLVLKICFPNLKVTLVDSLNKRIVFLNSVIKELDLKEIEVFHLRAEDFSKKNREIFDLVTCRALAKLNIISELCLPLVKINGYFIPMKANIEDEIKNTEFLKKLGSILEKIVTFKLPIEESIRNLIIVRKFEKTSIIYPRNFDKLKFNPL